MSKNNTSNFIIIDDNKNDQKEEYMNIAKHNEENFKTKKFEKFKPKNSIESSINLLTGEENKLKSMLFSIIKNEENRTIKIGKSPNNHYSNIISSINDESQVKKPLKKNYNQFKKNSKNFKVKIPAKTKKRRSEAEILDCKFISKNIYSKLFKTPEKDMKRNLSLENSKSQKELQNINTRIYNNKKSKKSINSFSKKEKDYNSNDNQNSSISFKLSSKNVIEKISDKLPIFFKKKEGKNCIGINTAGVEKSKNIYSSNNQNKGEKNRNFKRSFSLKNQKNFMEDNFNVLPSKKNRNSASNSIKIISNLKNSIIDFQKNDKNKKQLKINNMKILKINKEKIRKSLQILPDDQKKDSRHYESSCISNHKDRPKICDKLNLPPQRFCSSKDSVKNIDKTLLKDCKNKKLNKNEDNLKRKSTKYMMIFDEKFRKLNHKGLVYDSLDDDEFEFEDMASNNFYINPNSKFCFIFDLIIFCLTIYTSIIIPYFLAKNLIVCKKAYFSFFHILNYLSEIFNIIDTILGFFRAYYNSDEQLIKKSKLMIINYTKSWFLIDLIISIPFYSIFNLYEPQCTDQIIKKYNNNNMSSLYYIVLCTKMIKLFKVFKNNRGYKGICKILNHHIIFQNKGTLISQIYMILFIIHFGACIHIFIGMNSYPNWIVNIKMEKSEFLGIYLCAIYCLIMTITTVGYGDITCYSFNERIFQIILLIFGILAYSWIVSSISNYIEKHNSDLDEFNKKIDILNDIKLHYPNMTNKLYNKIILHIKYRNSHEKQNKNLIFDCLPLSLKNNLIYEMYKPIIRRFIFFKNIDNIDFIVKVILAFRPVIAIKNDIIINDGDIVEEIIFVKKGLLTVQLSIFIENYKENIKKYSNMNLFNLQSKSNLEKTSNISEISRYTNSYIEKIATHEKKYSLDSNSINGTQVKKIINDDKNKKYIKIINVRENEHFGDVLMFSGQRSPMRVVVRSTKAEFFILKKEDVVKISFTYSNIWNRINKKSVYNFEQMKKSIKKIIKVLSPQNQETNIFNLNEKDNKKKDSKNIRENESYNTIASSSSLTKSVINDDVKKENKNKDENIKEQNKIESSLILSTQYSNVNNDSKKFIFESNKKLKNKNETFKKAKKEIRNNNNNNKKRGYSAKFTVNKKNYHLHLNNNSIENNNINVINDQRIMTTPYREEEVNQEIYTHEKFELTNLDENSDNLLTKRKFYDNLIKSKNNINEINSKSEIKNDYVINKLNCINIISNINNIYNNNKNIISEGDHFSIRSSYENCNSLSENILINDKNLQEKIKLFLIKQITSQTSPKISHTIKIKNLNVDFTKINNENLVNNSSKIIKLSKNKKVSEKTLNDISFDSKNYNKNNISINGTPKNKYNYSKKDGNESILTSFIEGSNKILTNKTKSNLSFNRVYTRYTRRKNSINSSFQSINKSRRNSGNKINKNIDEIIYKSNKNDNNLLTLINDNILDFKENLIEPDKFYRRYFNELINNNSPINNQTNKKKEKYSSPKSRNNLSNFAGEYKNLSPKIKSKRYKSCSKKMYNK